MPKLAGTTVQGDPVFEVRNVRLVLRGDANYLSRLVTCTNCGREVPGLPVMSPGDLDHAPGPYVCIDCVEALRTGGEPTAAARAPAANGAPAGVPARVDQLAAANEALTRRLDELDRRLAAVAGVGQVEAVEVRLDQLEERVAGAGQAEAVEDRLQQLDQRLAGAREEFGQLIDERLGRVDSRLTETEDRVRAGLEQARAAAAVPADITDRLYQLEMQVKRTRADAAELVELHAALDAGLGTLRSEIGDVRSAVKRVADGHAELDDRLETYVRVSMSPDEGGKGRRSGRKGAGVDRVTTMAAAIDDILREQRVLRDQVAALAQASDGAAAIAARAANQASALSPLRSEIKLLHQEIAGHSEVLETLRKTVESRARAAPARKRAPAKKKA